MKNTPKQKKKLEKKRPPKPEKSDWLFGQPSDKPTDGSTIPPFSQIFLDQ